MADKCISKIKLVNDLYQLKDANAARQADFEALLAKVNTFLDAEGIKDETLDTLKEIQDFITNEAAAADELLKEVTDNSEAIADILDGTTPIDISLLAQEQGYIIFDGGTSTTVI